LAVFGVYMRFGNGICTLRINRLRFQRHLRAYFTILLVWSFIDIYSLWGLMLLWLSQATFLELALFCLNKYLHCFELSTILPSLVSAHSIILPCHCHYQCQLQMNLLRLLLGTASADVSTKYRSSVLSAFITPESQYKQKYSIKSIKNWCIRHRYVQTPKQNRVHCQKLASSLCESHSQLIKIFSISDWQMLINVDRIEECMVNWWNVFDRMLIIYRSKVFFDWLLDTYKQWLLLHGARVQIRIQQHQTITFTASQK